MNNSPDMHLDTKFQKLPPVRRWTKFPLRVWEVTGTKVINDKDGNPKEINLWSSRPTTVAAHKRRAALMAKMTGGI